MKSKTLFRATLATLLLGITPLHAAETTIDPKAETTTKNQVAQSMVGYRDTLLFYTFAAEKAVLVIRIDNKNEKFPMTAKLHVFAKEATADGLANWINNQHSDGLFPEVPEPVASHDIRAESYTLVSKKMVGAAEGGGPSGQFNQYTVEFKIANVPAVGEIKIKDFTDTTSVYIKISGEG
jgi:hypothetical protein